MDELEKIKAKKVQEMLNHQQEQLDKQNQQEMAAKQEIAEIEASVKPSMTKDAISRFGNLKSAHPENAVYALYVMKRLLENKKAQVIDEQTLISILQRLTNKKEFRIKRL